MASGSPALQFRFKLAADLDTLMVRVYANGSGACRWYSPLAATGPAIGSQAPGVSLTANRSGPSRFNGRA